LVPSTEGYLGQLSSNNKIEVDIFLAPVIQNLQTQQIFSILICLARTKSAQLFQVLARLFELNANEPNLIYLDQEFSGKKRPRTLKPWYLIPQCRTFFQIGPKLISAAIQCRLIEKVASVSIKCNQRNAHLVLQCKTYPM
jgi:hypothetical protein